MAQAEQAYSAYILYSPSVNSYYIGHTQKLQDRIENYHNAGRSLFTKRGIPWKLVYSESFVNRAQAMEREREIKSRKSRRYIERLVQSVPSRS